MEPLESVCLPNAAVPTPESLVDTGQLIVPKPTWSIDKGWASEPAETITTDVAADAASRIDAWDVALADHGRTVSTGAFDSADAFGESLALAGFGRMSHYLNRAWRKAGIEPPQDEDCTQSVYMVLLERWGRDRFEDVASEVGRAGLNRLVDRGDALGLDFLRALDQVKKQAQRQQRKVTLPLNDFGEASNRGLADAPDQQAIGRDLEGLIGSSLEPREADLIRATIAGDTPAEIAARWGVSSKTVSNVKSEAIGKLRSSLAEFFATDTAD
jgi:hypothetical protein